MNHPAEKNVANPICIAGARTCPPEDCGGIGGYAHFLEIIMNPTHEEYKEMLDWAGGDFDPEYFNANDVYFDYPDDRFEYSFS